MQLKNKAERERFLENYKNWELMHEVPELEIKFYRYTFPNGTVIIATEYACMKFARFGSKGSEYKKGTSVRYHLILHKSDKHKVQFAEYEYRVYNPSGDSKSSIVEYLTKTKPDIELCQTE